MNRHIVTFGLIVAMSVWSGCYESVQVMRDKVGQLDRSQDITVFVDSSANTYEYHFARGTFSVVHDTLVGTGTTITRAGAETEGVFSIPVSRIAYVETEKLNLLQTMLLAGTAVAATTLIFFSTSPGGSSSGSGGSGPHQGQ